MLHLSPSCRYYLYRGVTDMRKGFDSLCGMVTSQMQLSHQDGSIFIFFNRKHNQVKLLLFEGDGYAVYHKRLEKGTFEMPPCTDDCSSMNIRSQQLQFILQGISLKSVRKRKRYQHPSQISG